MLRAINRDRYEVIPVGITRDGAFVLEADDPDRFALDPERLPQVVDNGTRVRWPESAASRALTVTDGAGERSLGDVDVVFPILHGRFGEDGTVQGLLELASVPYVGSGVLGSAVGMDKAAMKAVFAAHGLAQTPYAVVPHVEWTRRPADTTARLQALGLPVFVKPANLGSSVGISKVKTWDALAAAMDTAFAFDR